MNGPASARARYLIQSTVIYVYCIVFMVLPGVGFTANAGAVEITLEWLHSNEGDVNGYKLYCRQEDQPYNYRHPIYSGTKNSCIVKGLQAGTAYYFIVKACHVNGHESPNSNEVSFYVEPTPVTVPAPETSAPAVDSDSPPGSPAASPEPPAVPENATPAEDEVSDGEQADGSAEFEAPAMAQWRVVRQIDDLCIFNAQSSQYLTPMELPLPALVLDEETVYYWQAKFLNEDGSLSNWSIPEFFTSEVWEADANHNGIPDDQECDTETEFNRNGTSATDALPTRCIRLANGDSLMINAQQPPAAVPLQAVQALNPAQIETLDEQSRQGISALINCKFLVTQPGDAAQLNLFFTEAIPADSTWLNFNTNTGWQREENAMTLSADLKSAIVQVQDGGLGDADGIANGVIVNWSGFISRQIESETSSAANQNPIDPPAAAANSGDSSNACFLQSTLSDS